MSRENTQFFLQAASTGTVKSEVMEKPKWMHPTVKESSLRKHQQLCPNLSPAFLQKGLLVCFFLVFFLFAFKSPYIITLNCFKSRSASPELGGHLFSLQHWSKTESFLPNHDGYELSMLNNGRFTISFKNHFAVWFFLPLKSWLFKIKKRK